MVLLRGFDDDFERIYGEQLRNKIDSLLKSGEKYHHEIGYLYMDFIDNSVVFKHKPLYLREPKYITETRSVQEAFVLIRNHVKKCYGSCFASQEEVDGTIHGLDSFLKKE